MADVAARETAAASARDAARGVAVSDRRANPETVGLIEGRRLTLARRDAQPEKIGLLERASVVRIPKDGNRVGLLEHALVTVLSDTTPPGVTQRLIVLTRTWA